MRIGCRGRDYCGGYSHKKDAVINSAYVCKGNKKK